MANDIYNLVRLAQLAENQISGYVLEIVLPLLTGFGSTGQLTGQYYPLYSNPSGYIQYTQTGIFVTNGQTGNFVTYDSPQFISTIISQFGTVTGLLNNVFYPLNSNPSGYLTSVSGLSGEIIISYNNSGNFNISSVNGSITGSGINIFGSNITFSGLDTTQNTLLIYGTTNQFGQIFISGNPVLTGNPFSLGEIIVTYDNSGSFNVSSVIGSISGSGTTIFGSNIVFSGLDPNQPTIDVYGSIYLNGTLFSGNNLTGSYYPLNSNPSGYLTSGSINGSGNILVTYNNSGLIIVSQASGSISGSGIVIFGNDILISGLVENQNIISFYGPSGQNFNLIETGNNLLLYNTTGNLAFSDEYNNIITLSQLLQSTGNTGSYYPLNSNPSGYLTSGNYTGEIIISYNTGGSINISSLSGSITGSGIIILGSNIVFSGLDFTQPTVDIYGSIYLNGVPFSGGNVTGSYYPLTQNPSGYLTSGNITGLGEIIVNYNNSGFFAISQISGSVNGSGIEIIGNNIIFSGIDSTQIQPVVIITGGNLVCQNIFSNGNLVLTTGNITGEGEIIVNYNSGYITVSQATGSITGSGILIIGNNITFSGISGVNQPVVNIFGNLYITGNNSEVIFVNGTNNGCSISSGNLWNNSGLNTIDWQNMILYQNIGNCAIDWKHRLLEDDISCGNTSIDWQNRWLEDATGIPCGGGCISIDYGDRLLIDANVTIYDTWGAGNSTAPVGVFSIDWANRFLYDADGAGGSPGTLSVDWNNRYLYDNNNKISIYWQNRWLYDVNQNISVDYSNRILTGSWNIQKGLFNSGLFISGNPVVTGGPYYPLNSNPAGYITNSSGGSVLQITGSSSLTTGNFTGVSGITILLSGINTVLVNGNGLQNQIANIINQTGNFITISQIGVSNITITGYSQTGNITFSGISGITFTTGSNPGLLVVGINTGLFYPASNPSGFGIGGGGSGTNIQITGSLVLTTANFTGISGVNISLSGNSVLINGGNFTLNSNTGNFIYQNYSNNINFSSGLNITGQVNISGYRALTLADTGNLVSNSYTNNILNISGLIMSVVNNVETGNFVSTYGPQNIYGTKTFSSGLIVGGTGLYPSGLLGLVISSGAYISGSVGYSGMVDASNKTSLDWVNRNLIDTNGYDSINWQNKTMVDAGNNVSFAWNSRLLYDAGQISSLDFSNRYLLSTNATSTVNWQALSLSTLANSLTVDWGNQKLYDNGPSNAISINWLNRYVYDNTASNSVSIDYGNRVLSGNWNIQTITGKLSFVGISGGTPVNTITVAKWLPVNLSGSNYFIPLYQ